MWYFNQGSHLQSKLLLFAKLYKFWCKMRGLGKTSGKNKINDKQKKNLLRFSGNTVFTLNKCCSYFIFLCPPLKTSLVNKKLRRRKKNKQEAHWPRVAHLSDIATADMQMLCNIFPILSSQLMKRSSFKQFFILKKKIYGMPVN